MIGQIANCPKCNSMIMIAPPQQIRVESQGAVDSNAMTKDGVAPIDDGYHLAEATETPDFAAVDGSLAAPPVADDSVAWEPHTGAPLMPSEQWTSPDAARKRQILMIVLLGGGGVVLSGLLFFAFLRWYSADRSNTDLAAQNQNPAQQAANNANDDHVTAPENGPPNSDPLAPDPLASDPLGADSAVDPAMEPSVSDPNAPPEKNAHTDEPEGPTAVIPNGNSQVPIPTADANSGTVPVKPVDGDITAVQPPDAAAAELPKQLEKFSALLESPQIAPQLPPEIAAIEKPPLTAEDLGLTQASESKAIPTVDVSRQMHLELGGLILNQLPTSHAINVWVQISGIPTYVDIDSFAAAGIDRNALVSVAFKNPEPFKMSEVAEELATQLGAVFEPLNNEFMMVHASSAAVEEHLPKSIKITDVAPDPDQQKWLLATLDQLFPNYTGKWQIADGNLSVDETEVDIATWMWIVRMLESWRKAATLDSQLEKLDAKKFVTNFVDPQKLETFDRPLQLVTLQATPAAQLISQICTASNLQAWVDWPSVGQNGLGYSSSDMVITHQRTLRQILRYYVEKYALVIAMESDDSLWITTPQSYRSQVRLYVLPSDGKTAEQWQDELEPLTPTGSGGIDQVQAILTPDSRFVIVRCCRPRINL